MDIQPPNNIVTPTQTTSTPPQPAPTPVTPTPAPVTPPQETPAPKKKGKFKKVLLVLFIVILLGAIGALGYMYYTTNEELTQTKNELAASQSKKQELTANLEDYEAVALFIEKENNAALSRQLCGGTPVGMFDVHINEKFATFRYLCSELTSAAPIRIGVLQKFSDGDYQFTYGSSDAAPNSLPDYVYDSEPEFFGPIYGTTRF